MLSCNYCQTESDKFYTSANPDGTWGIYCDGCYKTLVMDKYQGIVAKSTRVSGPRCECGTKSKLGRNHSTWCDLYMDEF